MPDFDVHQVREAAARAAHDARCVFHTSSGKFLGHYGIQQTVEWDVDAAMAVIVPAVTAQIRALHRCYHEDYLDVDCCSECSSETWWSPYPCPTVRLLDQIDAAVRGEGQ